MNIGRTRDTSNKRQQVEQAPWPPPSTPICRRQVSGIENMFIVKEATLPLDHRDPTGMGKLELIQDLHHKMVKEERAFYQVFRTADPYTHVHVPGTRRGCGRPKGLCRTSTSRSEQGGVDKHHTARMFLSEHCALARIYCLISAISVALFLFFQ